MTKRIVALAGSPSHPSRSSAVLEQAQSFLHNHGLSVELLLVRDLPADALLHAKFGDPAIAALTNQVLASDGLIVSTPIYKASYTGILKAFLDLLPQKALVGKPILPIATGGTLAHLLAIDYALNPVLSVLGAEHILQGIYLVDDQFQRLDGGGVEFYDTELEARFYQALQALAQSVKLSVKEGAIA